MAIVFLAGEKPVSRSARANLLVLSVSTRFGYHPSQSLQRAGRVRCKEIWVVTVRNQRKCAWEAYGYQPTVTTLEHLERHPREVP
jgi:hypothetical protein